MAIIICTHRVQLRSLQTIVVQHDVQARPAVTLDQLPAVAFHSLHLAVLRDVQVKAVGAVRKEQHMVYRVPATSTVHFLYDLQTGAATVDCARLVDDRPRSS